MTVECSNGGGVGAESAVLVLNKLLETAEATEAEWDRRERG